MSDAKRQRTDADYEIEAVSKALVLIDTLREGPAKMSAIEKRTGYNRNLTMRILRTYRLHGWVVENARGEWSLGPAMVKLSQDALNSDSAGI